MTTDRPRSLGNNFFNDACNSTQHLELQAKETTKSQVPLELLLHKTLAYGSSVSRGFQASTVFHFYLVRTAVFGSMYPPTLLICADLHKGERLVASALQMLLSWGAGYNASRKHSLT
jgi:hypothetical protein